MQTNKFFRLLGFAGLTLVAFQSVAFAQSNSLTPNQLEIARQQARLSSGEAEDRRDALARLGSMHQAEASRVALPALKDPLPIIRATAVGSILSLPPEESAASLIPLLNDKDEFVRRETAYALGKTRSRRAVARLSELLLTDKEDGVRGAAAVALGEIGDPEGVVALLAVLSPETATIVSRKNKKPKKEQNVFVLRSAARALGQIPSNAGVDVLTRVLQDQKVENDLRREAAIALGASEVRALSPLFAKHSPPVIRTSLRLPATLFEGFRRDSKFLLPVQKSKAPLTLVNGAFLYSTRVFSFPTFHPGFEFSWLLYLPAESVGRRLQTMSPSLPVPLAVPAGRESMRRRNSWKRSACVCTRLDRRALDHPDQSDPWPRD